MNVKKNKNKTIKKVTLKKITFKSSNTFDYAFFLSAAQHFFAPLSLEQDAFASTVLFVEHDFLDLSEQDFLASALPCPEHDFFASAFEHDFFASADAHDFLASADLDAQHDFFVLEVASTLVSARSTFTFSWLNATVDKPNPKAIVSKNFFNIILFLDAQRYGFIF